MIEIIFTSFYPPSIEIDLLVETVWTHHSILLHRDTNLIIINHPSSDVDLCAILVDPDINKIAKTTSLRHSCMHSALLPAGNEKDTFSPIENIIMVGYPNSLWDNVNNLPIARNGITATHPLLNWQGKQEFLIDCACSQDQADLQCLDTKRQCSNHMADHIRQARKLTS